MLLDNLLAPLLHSHIRILVVVPVLLLAPEAKVQGPRFLQVSHLKPYPSLPNLTPTMPQYPVNSPNSTPILPPSPALPRHPLTIL